FKDYYNWQEPVRLLVSHRVLAMRRGENEGFLMLRIIVPEQEALAILNEMFVKKNKAMTGPPTNNCECPARGRKTFGGDSIGEGPNLCASQVEMAIEDSFKRL